MVLSWPQLYQSFVLRCEGMNLTARTIDNYKEKLGHFLRWTTAGPAEIERSILRSFLDSRRATGAGTFTIHAFWRVLRTFFGYLKTEGLMAHDPTDGLEAPVREKKLPVVFTPTDLLATLEQIDRSDPLGVRDYAAILFIADAWVRISEALGLRIDGLDISTHSAKVYGKGRKERVVGFGKTTAQALARWLAVRPECGCDLVFINRYGQPLSAYTLSQRIKGYTVKAGVAKFRLGAHAARHMGAIQSLLDGLDMVSVQRQLGHTTLEATRIYTQIANEDALRGQQRTSPIDRLVALKKKVVL